MTRRPSQRPSVRPVPTLSAVDHASRQPAPVLPTLRERVVAEAADLTCEVGWSGVTMGRLADRVGVSRQTVYNEIGSKPQLAEAMVMRELATFLATVEEAFDRSPDDAGVAVRQAVRNVLALGGTNRLLHAVVSVSQGGSSGLLPLLTTRSDALVEGAKVVVLGRLASFDLGLDARHLDVVVDLVVRATLSHVMRPAASPDETASDLAWVVERVLRP